MGKIISFLNKPVLVAIVVGLFLLSVVRAFARR